MICGREYGDGPETGNNCGPQFGWLDTAIIATHDCCLEPFQLAWFPYSILASRCTGCTTGQVFSKIGSTICETIDQVGCKIDRDIAILTIPAGDPCKDKALTFQSTLENQNLDLSSVRVRVTLAVVGADIQRAFDCLHYLYFVNPFGTNKKCTNLLDIQKGTCNSCVSGDPIFNLSGFDADDQTVVLPSRPNRVTGASDKGRFLLDDFVFNEPGATFIADVFEEYMGCAVSSCPF